MSEVEAYCVECGGPLTDTVLGLACFYCEDMEQEVEKLRDLHVEFGIDRLAETSNAVFKLTSENAASWVIVGPNNPLYPWVEVWERLVRRSERLRRYQRKCKKRQLRNKKERAR